MKCSIRRKKTFPLNQIIHEQKLREYITTEPFLAGAIVNGITFEFRRYYCEDHSLILNPMHRCRDLEYIICYRIIDYDADIRFIGNPNIKGLSLIINWLKKHNPISIYFDRYTKNWEFVEAKRFNNNALQEFLIHLESIGYL